MSGLEQAPGSWDAAAAAGELVAIGDPDLRRAARLRMREQALDARFKARRHQGVSKLADAVAKFGGGSLLTATLLLIVGGRTDGAVIALAVSTLLSFIGGTILWVYYDRLSASLDRRADLIDAVLKETER